jgi:hypothetical protein
LGDNEMNKTTRILLVLGGVACVAAGVDLYFNPVFEPDWRNTGKSTTFVFIGLLLVAIAWPSKQS